MDKLQAEYRNFELASLIRPIVALTENLPQTALETIVVETLQRYRLCRDVAESTFADCALETITGATISEARMSYVRAMIECHTQQSLLSILLDILGYIPSASDETE